jgi:hypothetical protein
MMAATKRVGWHRLELLLLQPGAVTVSSKLLMLHMLLGVEAGLLLLLLLLLACSPTCGHHCHGGCELPAILGCQLPGALLSIKNTLCDLGVVHNVVLDVEAGDAVLQVGPDVRLWGVHPGPFAGGCKGEGVQV